MTRPIAYNVPVFIEESKKDESEKRITAAAAMQEWMKWIAYVNQLEADKARLIEALNIAAKKLVPFGEHLQFTKLLTEMEGK